MTTWNDLLGLVDELEARLGNPDGWRVSDLKPLSDRVEALREELGLPVVADIQEAGNGDWVAIASDPWSRETLGIPLASRRGPNPLVSRLDNLPMLRARLSAWHRFLTARKPPESTEASAEDNGDRLSLEGEVARVRGRSFAVTPNQARILEILVANRGEFVSLSRLDVKPRDLDTLPRDLRKLIERRKGAGTRLKWCE